ncbi:malto-oligosyltrehalose synthase [Streptomyces sp. HNM0663]|uniref:Malto-oligosyltrehalose synthase n=1 Tax=Streptomyces chengmaiensis TaxID=3040919 RepID=A0ABT6HQQ9_9ACTN|nr:malto-oligosyltrehalose synthase [Streptomyces chengmaiensis]MDH2391061.1 malto-oligosyltrehalose synthase [Streptomyces chengmaiensis]
MTDTPTATYRLQLQPGFPFSAAAAAVPYLASLGVSHLHLSPVLEAVPGSAHGYDVVDPGRVREELGGEHGLRQLARTAHEHGLGLVLDIVPNHMAAVPRHNRALWEVLREGPSSPYARWFDVDWEAGGGKILLPVLAGRLGDELGELRVEGEVLHYGEHRFPLRTGTAGLTDLGELLDAQWYRLCWWRLARTELNYRRFFTVSELIGVRVEDPEVFDATHATVVRLVREGMVQGLRVDHPDGLADPEGYLRRLAGATGGRCWIVVEKILTGDERLPGSWAVAGTTGYDALRRIDGLFIDPDGLDELTHRYREFTGAADDLGGSWEATARRAAYKVITHDLAAEAAALTRMAQRLCAAGSARRDHAPWALHRAVRELLVRVPVYRPYREGGAEVLTAEAARQAKAAFAVAKEAEAVDAVRDLALGRGGDGPLHEAFRARFAQTSSALRAKSVEDLAFYRYTPLLSANEVGGEPGRPAVGPDAFHAHCARTARDWPASGTVLTTHDTKRSADVRAAIAVLSQFPGEWAEFTEKIGVRAARLEGGRAPDAHLAWTAWQTALGFGFPYEERLRNALLKAVREAGVHTSWTEPDAAYEQAVADFVAAGPAGPPMRTTALFRRGIDAHVRANVLGATLVQLTMPGVPEVYQGAEREYLALVDPDNRTPARFPTSAQARPDDQARPRGLSAEKLALTAAALRLRRDRPGVFGPGSSYAPLYASGPAAHLCLAFLRSAEAAAEGSVVTAVTRLSRRLARSGGWGDTALPLPDGRWRDALAPGRVFRGGPLALGELFADRPVALLVRDAGERDRAASAAQSG